MDLKFEILKYSQKSTCKDMQERKGFFMFPYYNYIYDAIAKIIDKYPFVQMNDIVGQLSYQVVSYAYNNYLKFVYNSSLKFEITAKRLCAASRRVL